MAANQPGHNTAGQGSVCSPSTPFSAPLLPPNTPSAPQVVDVDENVHTPVFMKDVEEARVVESAPPNTLVGTFSAVDGDSNPADAFVRYSLVGPEGRGVFYIDQTGECGPSTCCGTYLCVDVCADGRLVM